MSLITFAAFSIVPGDPARIILGATASEAKVAALREELGLNRPLPVRYADWLGGAITGDLGESLVSMSPSPGLIWQKLPVTFAVAMLSLLMTILFSFPAGNARVKAPGQTTLTKLFLIISHIFFAIPPFVIGLAPNSFPRTDAEFCFEDNYIPYSENFCGFLGCLIVPALAIALPKIAMSLKFLRASILSEKGKDYVRTAKSHGLSDTAVMLSIFFQTPWFRLLRFSPSSHPIFSAVV